MKKILVITVLILGLGIGSYLIYNNLYLPQKERRIEINSLLAQLDSPDWQERDRALWELKKFKDDERVKVALIQLLEKEQALLEKIRTGEVLPRDRGEGPGEYHLAVVETVEGLKDRRAIPALVESLWSGRPVGKALAEMGESAVDPVMAKLNAEDLELRSGAVFTLGEFLRRDKEGEYTLQKATKDKIRKALIGALKDDDGFTRRNAVQGLGYVADAEIISLLKKVAAEDPDIDKGTFRGDIYPVREEAEKVLKELEAKSN